MSDPELGVLTAAGGVIAALIRWAVALWATVRREDISASGEAAKLKREADNRNVDRQIATIDRIDARVAEHTTTDLAHHAAVHAAIARMEAKFDAVVDWRDRDRTPPPVDEVRHDSQRRLRTNPHGYRPPRPGEHDDH